MLYGEAIETVAALLVSSDITRRELARRLGVSEARVTRILNGRENTTLKTVADLGWALGVRFAFVPIPYADREGTPAAADPTPPRWLASLRRRMAKSTSAAGPSSRPGNDAAAGID
ncbi:MAG TPA: helix-turn-helix transcriptional regulator [Solirubrobacterales bacterium]